MTTEAHGLAVPCAVVPDAPSCCQSSRQCPYFPALTVRGVKYVLPVLLQLVCPARNCALFFASIYSQAWWIGEKPHVRAAKSDAPRARLLPRRVKVLRYYGL